METTGAAALPPDVSEDVKLLDELALPAAG